MPEAHPRMKTHSLRPKNKAGSRSRHRSSPRPTFLTAVGIEETPPLPLGAVRSPFIKSWEYPNDCLEGFVHDMASLLTSKRLRLLEWFFEQNGSRVWLLQFIQMMLVILQPYIPPRQCPTACSPRSRYSVEELRLVHLLSDMFAHMDADCDGVLHWEEFTSFLIAVHATAERPSHATHQRPQRYLRGSNVRPPIDKPDVPCLKKIAYLATSVLTPRNAINKVYHFPGTDVVAAVEQEGRRASLYTATRLHRLGALSPAESDERIQCVAHVPVMRCYAVVTSRPSLCLYHEGTRALRVTVPLRRPPLCLATVATASHRGLLFGGHADGRLYGCRLSTWESEVQWADLMPAAKHMHTDAVVDTLWWNTAEAVATAGMDCVVKLWDLEKQECRQVFMGHERGVKALASNEGLRLLFSGGFDSEVLVWSPRHSCPVAHLRGHKHAVVKVQSVEDSFELFSADASGVIKLWDVRNYQCVQTIRKDATIQPLTNFVALGARHRRLVTVSNTLQVYDLQGSVAVGDEHAAINVVFNTTSQTIMLTSNRETRIWDAISGSLIRAYNPLNDDERVSLTSACLDGRRRKLLVGDSRGMIKAYDYSTGALLKTMKTRIQPSAHNAVNAVPQGVSVTHMVYAPEHRAVISVCSDRSLCIHDESQPYTGALIRRIEKVHEAPISALAYQAGVIVTGAMTTGEVRVWDYESGRLEACCLGHGSAVVSIEFLDPYPALLTADSAGVIIIWGMRPCVFAFQKLYSWSQSGVGVSRTCIYRVRACDKKQLRREEKAEQAGEKPLDFRQEAMRYEKYRYNKADPVSGAVSRKWPTPEEAMAKFASMFAIRSPILADYKLFVGDEAGSVSVWDMRPLLELLGRHYLHRLDNANNTRPIRDPRDAAVRARSPQHAISPKSCRAQSPSAVVFTFSESDVASAGMSPGSRRAQGVWSPSSTVPAAAASPRTKAGSPRPPFRIRNIMSPSAAGLSKSPRATAGQVVSPGRGLLSPAAGAVAPSSASRADRQSGDMEAARRAAAAFRVPLLAMWQAYDAPIVSIQTIVDPPAVLTCTADKAIRVWNFKGAPLGELTNGKPKGWRLPVKRKLLEERRLQAAAETLDSLQREMNLAAEHALAMEEQKQHQVGHAYGNRQRALAAQAERLAESTGAAVMSPAAAREVPAAGSLTHRITSIEKIIATAEIQAQERHLAERLAPPSPPPLTGKRPRPKIRIVTRLVQNATRFIRAVKGTELTYSQGMRTAGLLSPKPSMPAMASQKKAARSLSTRDAAVKISDSEAGVTIDAKEPASPIKLHAESVPFTNPTSQASDGGATASQTNPPTPLNAEDTRPACAPAPAEAGATATALPQVGAAAGTAALELRHPQTTEPEQPRLRPRPPANPALTSETSRSHGGWSVRSQRPGFGRSLRAVDTSAGLTSAGVTAEDEEDDMANLEHQAARLEQERKTLMRLLSPTDPVADEAADPRLAALSQAFGRRESDGFSTGPQPHGVPVLSMGHFVTRHESTMSLDSELIENDD